MSEDQSKGVPSGVTRNPREQKVPKSDLFRQYMALQPSIDFRKRKSVKSQPKKISIIKNVLQEVPGAPVDPISVKDWLFERKPIVGNEILNFKLSWFKGSSVTRVVNKEGENCVQNILFSFDSLRFLGFFSND